MVLNAHKFPEKICSLFNRLRYLLSNDDAHYARLLSRFTAGRLARLVDAEWDATSHSQTARLARFLAELRTVLPPESAQALLSGSVAPKLARAALKWDFATEADAVLTAVGDWTSILDEEDLSKLMLNVPIDCYRSFSFLIY